jgi:threonine dehydratase
MQFAFEYLKIVIEPSGAVALAALLAGRISPIAPRIGLVLSGGNIAGHRFTDLLTGRPATI